MTRTLGLRLAPHLAFVALALSVTARLWIHRGSRLTLVNPTDHEQFLWFLANAAHAVAHGENPLVTHRLNAPDPVNLMANTSVLGLGIPLAPVTLLFGVATTFVLTIAGSLAATASAWYAVLRRHVVDSRLAAFVGAGFCGFAPGMVAQASGHPNLVAQFLVPLLVWRVTQLREAGRSVRNGLILALVVGYQVFLNEEILLITALACAVLVGWYALTRWREVGPAVRPFLTGLAVTTVTAGLLLAYPMYVQFFGPGHYRGLPPGLDRFATDLASFPVFARRTLLGSARLADHVTLSANEEASFLGPPLFLFMIGAAVAMWRRTLVQALLVIVVIFTVLSLGPSVTVYGHHTHIPGPLRLLRHIPPFDLATATRYALVVVPVVGVLLALACAALLRWSAGDPRRRVLALALVGVALVPLLPKPIQVRDRPVPAFVSSGEWKRYVTGDRTLVPVPLPQNIHMDGMRWAALSNADFAIPRGYFMGPTSMANDRNAWNPAPRPTATLLGTVALTGKVPTISDVDRAAAQVDLRYWRAAIVVVSLTEREAPALVATVTALLGPGTWDEAGGVWRWDVR
jgi:hypothetical protein